MEKKTVSIVEAMKLLRANGIPIGQKKMRLGLESGALPFGQVISKGENRNNSYLIFKSDLLRWIEAHS